MVGLRKKHRIPAVILSIFVSGLLIRSSIVHWKSTKHAAHQQAPEILVYRHHQCPARNPQADVKYGTEVNTLRKTETKLYCVAMGVWPLPVVCVHPFRHDEYISTHIVKHGAYERQYIEDVFLPILSKLGPCAGIIDIGANIGEYTLVAAGLGHQVVAVEPVTDNIVRLVRALQLNGFQDRVVVLKNVVSNNRKPLKLKSPPANIAATFLDSLHPDGLSHVAPSDYKVTEHVQSIVMNDLVAYCNFTTAIIKIDIESSEIFAFALSTKLLQELHIPYIMMEWRHVVNFGRLPHTDQHYQLTVRLVEQLTRMGYNAHSMQDRLMPLDANMWHKWTTPDILWHKVGTSLN